MFWYILTFALAMMFASSAQSLKGKSDLQVDGGVFHYRSTYRCMVVLSFLPVFILAAIRYEVGTDWSIYLDYYHWINEGTNAFSEKLFNLLNKLVGWTIGDFQGMVVLVAFLACFFVYKAIYEQSISAPLSLLIYFISTLYFASINQMRQAIAMPIMLYAFKYIQQKKLIPYLFWGVVAVLIHTSSLVFLPLYFVVGFKPTFKRYVLLFGGCLIALPVLQAVFEFLLAFSKYSWYTNSYFDTGDTANNFYLVGFVFQMIVLVIMAYYRFTTDGEEPEFDSMLNCYFLSVLALLFTPVLSQVLRISQCLSYCQILLIPRVINREKDRTRRIVLYALIVTLYVVKMLYDTYHLGWNGVIPYQTIFTK